MGCQLHSCRMRRRYGFVRRPDKQLLGPTSSAVFFGDHVPDFGSRRSTGDTSDLVCNLSHTGWSRHRSGVHGESTIHCRNSSSSPAWPGLVRLNQFAIVSGMLLVYLVNYQIARLVGAAWNVSVGWRWMFGSGALPRECCSRVCFSSQKLPVPGAQGQRSRSTRCRRTD